MEERGRRVNGREILEHFAHRLSLLHRDTSSLPVLRLTSPPSSPHDLDRLRTTYEGSPAVFPASWVPSSWEHVLGVSCLSLGLRNLLGNIVEVDAFRLQYQIDGGNHCNQAAHPEGIHWGCQQAFHFGSVSAEASADQLKVSEGLGELSKCENHSFSHDFAPLHPVPVSTTETLEFGAFLSESSSMMGTHKNQLMYLTWRSLPEHCRTISAPEEFCYFINRIIHPVTTPDFIVTDSIKQRNFWMGSLITSRIHFDALDNIHVCLSGRKVFHLYSPLELPNLYPEPWQEDAMNNFSSIGSIFLADRNKHARYFHNVKRFWTEVNSGEAIFIPAGWWHEVFTLQETISVNVWFGPSSNALFRPTLLHLKSEKYLQFMLARSE